MTMFEVISALSLTLALAIPTFMDKVMRPKYEEQFSEFKKTRTANFIDQLEKALSILKKSKEDLTPETVSAMESLFEEWSQVKTDENKLTTFLKYRKFFFAGWFVSLGLGLSSIQYSDVLVSQNSTVTLGQVTLVVFALMSLASIWYVIQLFMLDETLIESKVKKTGETYGKVESAEASLIPFYVAEKNVQATLERSGVEFEKQPFAKIDGQNLSPDYVVPDLKTPKYLIEIITRPTLNVIQAVGTRYRNLRTQTSVKTVLVSDFKRKPSLLGFAKEYWDFLVDLDDLGKLEQILRG